MNNAPSSSSLQLHFGRSFQQLIQPFYLYVYLIVRDFLDYPRITFLFMRNKFSFHCFSRDLLQGGGFLEKWHFSFDQVLLDINSRPLTRIIRCGTLNHRSITILASFHFFLGILNISFYDLVISIAVLFVDPLKHLMIGMFL